MRSRRLTVSNLLTLSKYTLSEWLRCLTQPSQESSEAFSFSWQTAAVSRRSITSLLLSVCQQKAWNCATRYQLDQDHKTTNRSIQDSKAILRPRDSSSGVNLTNSLGCCCCDSRSYCMQQYVRLTNCRAMIARENRAMHFGIDEKPTRDSIPYNNGDLISKLQSFPTKSHRKF